MTFNDAFVHDNYADHLPARHPLWPLLSLSHLKPRRRPMYVISTIMPTLQQLPLRLGGGQGLAQGHIALERPRAGISICVWRILNESTASLWCTSRGGNLYSVFPPRGQSWSPSSSLPGNLVNSFKEPNKCALWIRGLITPRLLCTIARFAMHQADLPGMNYLCRQPSRPLLLLRGPGWSRDMLGSSSELGQGKLPEFGDIERANKKP